MGPLDLARLGWAGRAVAAGELATYTVPVCPADDLRWCRRAGAPAARSRGPVPALRDGRILAEVTGEDEPEISREEIRVSVANGAGIAGLAGSVADGSPRSATRSVR
jgi:hypothetical protein